MKLIIDPMAELTAPRETFILRVTYLDTPPLEFSYTAADEHELVKVLKVLEHLVALDAEGRDFDDVSDSTFAVLFCAGEYHYEYQYVRSIVGMLSKPGKMYPADFSIHFHDEAGRKHKVTLDKEQPWSDTLSSVGS